MLKQMSNAIRIEMTNNVDVNYKYPAKSQPDEHHAIQIHEAAMGVPKITIIQPKPNGWFFMQVEYNEEPVWYMGIGNSFYAVEEIVDWYIEA